MCVRESARVMSVLEECWVVWEKGEHCSTLRWWKGKPACNRVQVFTLRLVPARPWIISRRWNISRWNTMHHHAHMYMHACMHSPPGAPPSVFYAEPRALDNTRFMRDGGHWEDAHFMAHFRMCKAHFFHLASLLEPVLKGGLSNFKEPIGVPVKLAVGLAKLTNEAITYSAIHLMFGVARSTACKVVHQVVRAINDVMRSNFLPRLNQNTAEPVKAAFKRKGFPNCMGAIDGTHFKILKPNTPKLGLMRLMGPGG